MADIKTIPLAASYDDLREEVATPMVRCEARALTAALAPAFDALLPQIDATEVKEWQLTLDVLRAEALVFVLDEGIDHTVDAVVNTILTITGQSRTHSLYVLFLGSQEPAELKAPILEEELDTLEKVWLPELQATQFQELAVFAKPLQQQIDDARKAEAALDKARQALDHFRSEQGERGKLVADINGVRKNAHGQIGAITHANPLALWPPNFNDTFFPTGRTGRKLTARELANRVTAMEKALQGLRDRLADARAEDQKKTDKKAKREAARRQKEIDKAEKKAAQAAAKVAALKAAVPPAPAPTPPADPPSP